MPPFSQYRAWLASPEYKKQIAVLLAAPNEPPKRDWPQDVRSLITMHRELGTMSVRIAVDHFKKADALEAAQLAAYDAFQEARK
jgi:hypothetical protein